MTRTALVLDQFSDLGGAQRCLLELLPPPEGSGWRAVVAVPVEGVLIQLLRSKGIEVHPLPLRTYALGRKSLHEAISYVRDLRALGETVRDLVERQRPDLLYVNGPRLVPAVVRARTGLPIVFHSHNRIRASGGRWIVTRALVRSSATVIAASRALADQWPGRVEVVYGGVEGPRASWRRRPPSGAPRAGLIARFVPSKGQHVFVRAAAALASAWPGAEFVLCGDPQFGDARGDRYKADVLRLAPPSVRALGWREDVYDVLAGLDILVLPSTDEGGIPSVILEALAAGVAVLTTPVGGIPEVLREGETGFFLDSANAALLAARLGELFASPDRIAAVAARGHALWRERFTAERFRGEVWRILDEAASPREPHRPR